MKPTILEGDLRKKEHNNNVPGVLQCAYFHDIQLHPSKLTNDWLEYSNHE